MLILDVRNKMENANSCCVGDGGRRVFYLSEFKMASLSLTITIHAQKEFLNMFWIIQSLVTEINDKYLLFNTRSTLGAKNEMENGSSSCVGDGGRRASYRHESKTASLSPTITKAS